MPRGQQAVEVRGARVRPLDDAKERRKEAKQQREERLEKWFGLPKPHGRGCLKSRRSGMFRDVGGRLMYIMYIYR